MDFVFITADHPIRIFWMIQFKKRSRFDNLMANANLAAKFGESK